jgi:hypothetical protein
MDIAKLTADISQAEGLRLLRWLTIGLDNSQVDVYTFGMTEEWREITGFPGYEVSNTGRVASVDRTHLRIQPTNLIEHIVRLKRKELKQIQVKNQCGRIACMVVTLCVNGERFRRRVHALVLNAFVGPCPDGMEGCHNDGNPMNNRVGNLRWDTHANNMLDQEMHGTKFPPPHKYGEDHHNVTISDADVEMLRKHHFKLGDIKMFAERFGVHPNTITRLRLGKSRSGQSWTSKN